MSDAPWNVVLVPDSSRPETKFVEARRGDEVFRAPEPIWLEQVTATPGKAGDGAHEQWLQGAVKYRADDIVIATYPKCGTTLTEQIVLLLLNGGDAAKLDPLSKNSANMHGGHGKVWPEACVVPDGSTLQHPPGRPPKDEMVALELSSFDALPSPRVIKTHANVGRVLGRSADGSLGAARYIVVTRNPLDACVSCYYHAWNPHRKGWPFEAFARTWLEDVGNGHFGGWFAFHQEWAQVAAQHPPSSGPADGGEGAPEPRILWLHYEEMVRNPTREIGRVATFLGLGDDPALVERVVAGSSFDSMKSSAVAAEQQGGRSMTAAHLRKGGVGDWRNHFSPPIESQLRELFAQTMRGTGLEFDIGDGETLTAPPPA